MGRSKHLEQYIRHELLYITAHFTDIETIVARVELSVPGVEPPTSSTAMHE